MQLHTFFANYAKILLLKPAGHNTTADKIYADFFYLFSK